MFRLCLYCLSPIVHGMVLKDTSRYKKLSMISGAHVTQVAYWTSEHVCELLHWVVGDGIAGSVFR